MVLKLRKHSVINPSENVTEIIEVCVLLIGVFTLVAKCICLRLVFRVGDTADDFFVWKMFMRNVWK